MNEFMAKSMLLEIEKKIGSEETGISTRTWSDVIQDIIAVICDLSKENEKLKIKCNICVDRASRYRQEILHLAALLAEFGDGGERRS